MIPTFGSVSASDSDVRQSRLTSVLLTLMTVPVAA